MGKVNAMYLVGRAKIYRDEAQRGIELESQGDPQRALLVWKSLKRACEAELDNYDGKDGNYAKFLHTMADHLKNEGEVMSSLESIRVCSRNYLKVNSDK